MINKFDKTSFLKKTKSITKSSLDVIGNAFMLISACYVARHDIYDPIVGGSFKVENGIVAPLTAGMLGIGFKALASTLNV